MFVATPSVPILELKSISKRFGGLQVLKSIDLAIVPGERCAIIGPNGAGQDHALQYHLRTVATDERRGVLPRYAHRPKEP